MSTHRCSHAVFRFSEALHSGSGLALLPLLRALSPPAGHHLEAGLSLSCLLTCPCVRTAPSQNLRHGVVFKGVVEPEEVTVPVGPRPAHRLCRSPGRTVARPQYLWGASQPRLHGPPLGTRRGGLQGSIGPSLPCGQGCCPPVPMGSSHHVPCPGDQRRSARSPCSWGSWR